jgi:hypothetical protein
MLSLITALRSLTNVLPMRAPQSHSETTVKPLQKRPVKIVHGVL